MIRQALILGAVLVSHAFAAFELMPGGPRTAALGGAAVALSDNPWAGAVNPAMISAVKKPVISLGFSPSPFGLRELSGAAVAYVDPLPLGSISVQLAKFGFELYREMIGGFSYGRTITDNVMVGATLRVYVLSIAGYGSDWTIGADIGGAVDVSGEIRVAFALHNISAPAIGVEHELLPQSISMGMSFAPLRELVVVAELEKDLRYQPEFHLGVEYALGEYVVLRGGMIPEPAFFSAGFGMNYGPLRLDYGISHHVLLGMMHLFGVSVVPSEL